MINFRYHIVSLISVFLALAVGIILGAGPLKESIGDQLSGQVSALRAEKEDLRAQLQQEQAASERGETVVGALAPAVLSGTLDGADVTVVELGSGLDDEFKALSTQLSTAGAVVRGRIQVTSTWTDPSGATTLDETAPELAAEGLAIDTGRTSAQQAAQALALAVSTADPAGDGGALSDQARTTLGVLRSAGLVDVERTPTVAADAIVVLDGSPEGQSSDATPGADESQAYTSDRELEIVTAAHAAVPDTVVAGPADDPTGVVAAVRDDGDLQVVVSTVSGADTLSGQVSVALALADQAAGSVGHYGFDDGATAAVPALPPARDSSPSGTGK
ncbi:copper transporter [Luteimicrobium subarcticum]|uniref:Copper transport outer membrane protein MctB n=1 Tax=Luteimicrobium subarcticum TaxID=620910 RepID=A0A2M8WWI6_9MICO|nr:copper transporter [Luteimicrobium subarcticum]PJI95289.1 copper transport outer membrane protein MctB [Luteimicrobium subarcticum]